MRLLTRLILSTSMFLSGCSTHRVRLVYTPPTSAPQGSRTLPATLVGEFADERGDDAQRDNGTWIGAVRGGYGNTIKTVLVERPLRDIVAATFAQALGARGSFADSQHTGTRVLSGSVAAFACKQYVRRDCTVALNVVLTDRVSGQKIFEKKYEAYEFDGSVWAMDSGIFGSVDKLRDLAARTLAVCVDKVLDDGGLINAASQPAGPKEQSRQTSGRLHELKALLDQGLISREEYERKRSAILQDL